MSWPCFFVSDLHGRSSRWRALCECIERERPGAVFIGGDLLPRTAADRFLDDARLALRVVCDRLGATYPRVFLILGNDDPRALEADVTSAGADGLWDYVHNRERAWDRWRIFGYACVPPTPFQLKDWERYDVSRFVDPGCISPEEGRYSVAVDLHEIRHGTIARDLERLAPDGHLADAIWLFHSPPYQTALDRAALDGQAVDHAPLDVHVGSVAIRRFIEARQPAITLHGHIHESARLTGRWLDRLGATISVTAAHDGDELALVRFDPANPGEATRELIPVTGPGSGCGRRSPAGGPRR